VALHIGGTTEATPESLLSFAGKEAVNCLLQTVVAAAAAVAVSSGGEW
jgi:hypothetical protein